MKRYIFPLLLFVLLTGVHKTYGQAQAQVSSRSAAGQTPQSQQLTPQQKQEYDIKMAEHLSKAYDSQLSLTTDQKKKVYAACLSYIQSVNVQGTSKSLSNEEQMKHRDDMNKKIQGVLTKEQNQKFQSTFNRASTSRN